jgi:MFS transporter, DHA2 family, methylenomycin A resistance protein
MLIGALLTPFSARLAEKLGARALIIIGLILMTAGLAAIAVTAPYMPVPGLALLMILTGLGGPLVMPPMTAVLLNSVPPRRAGTASGVFNTSRQVGGALAIAVFGALLASRAGFLAGLRTSLLIAAAVALTAAAGSILLQQPLTRAKENRVE